MSSATKIGVVLFGAFVAGALAGGALLGVYCQNALRFGEVSRMSFDVVVLERIQQSKIPEASGLLENDLDRKCLVLGLDDVTLSRARDPRIKTVLAKVAKYRAEFPHSPADTNDAVLIKRTLSE